MKGLLLAFLSVFTIATLALAQPSFEEKMALKEIVAKWNNSLHITTIPQLNNLYASSVFSYGQYRTRDACIKEKSDAVNGFAGFHQEIITPIQITCYQSGTFKCDFTKRVRYKQRVEDYAAYLLVRKMGEKYFITGEGDLRTDSALNVKLDLGEPITAASSTSETYWLIFAAVSVLFIVLAIWLMGKSGERSLEAPVVKRHPRPNPPARSKETALIRPLKREQ